MNGLMVIVGLLAIGVGAVSFTYPREDTEFGLRLRGVDSASVDLSDRSNAVRRTKLYGGVTALLGATILVWGVFGWPGETLAAVLFFGGGLLYGVGFLLTQ